MAELDNLSLEGFDLGAALGISPEAEAAKKTPPPEQGGIKVSHRMGARQLWRKAASEKALEDAMPSWHFREGDCYHCFSFGDVDSFSFFKMVLRQQPIKYAAISTWCVTFKKFAMSLPSRILDAITGFSEIDPLSARRLDKMIQQEIQGLLEAFVVAGVTEKPKGKNAKA